MLKVKMLKFGIKDKKFNNSTLSPCITFANLQYSSKNCEDFLASNFLWVSRKPAVNSLLGIFKNELA
jgi:hypothetical protein